MNKHYQQFDSAKIGHNILWEDQLLPSKRQTHQKNTLASKTNHKHGTGINQSSHILSEVEKEVLDLEDIWNAVEKNDKQEYSKSRPNTNKIEIMNICDQPATLTAEEFQEVFGVTEKQNEKSQNVHQMIEKVEDLGQLWDQLDATQLQHQNGQKQTKNEALDDLNAISLDGDIRDLRCAIQIEDKRSEKEQQEIENESEFFEIEEKDLECKTRTCLTLGKNYHIYDLSSFVTSCFSTNIYSYFGFQQPKQNYYTFSNLTTNEVLMSCTLSKYQQFSQTINSRTNILFQTNFCLKMRLREDGDMIANIWQKVTANGILYNLRQYNYYEQKYEDSLALIEIADGYIGNNCYCNTTVYISQKHSAHKGPLKMRLSLKNGYLIAHMGVNGIRSAPYNCRLESSNDSFVYLLGMIEKDCERFLLRVGEGISPVVAFAIAVGRKRYIDSFKQ